MQYLYLKCQLSYDGVNTFIHFCQPSTSFYLHLLAVVRQYYCLFCLRLQAFPNLQYRFQFICLIHQYFNLSNQASEILSDYSKWFNLRKTYIFVGLLWPLKTAYLIFGYRHFNLGKSKARSVDCLYILFWSVPSGQYWVHYPTSKLLDHRHYSTTDLSLIYFSSSMNNHFNHLSSSNMPCRVCQLHFYIIKIAFSRPG